MSVQTIHIRKNKKDNNIPFEFWSKKLIKDELFELQEGKCNNCKLSHWLNVLITFELDHIDGNNRNNKIENVRLLCPNCHSLTDNWRGKNINTGKIKVTDEELINLISISKNIHEVLLKSGLAPKGGNYNRIKKIIFKHKLEFIFIERPTNKYGTSNDYFNAIKNQNDVKSKEKLNKLLNSKNINFNKLGWVNQAAKILEISPNKVNMWMKRFAPEFYKTCFVRKQNNLITI